MKVLLTCCRTDFLCRILVDLNRFRRQQVIKTHLLPPVAPVAIRRKARAKAEFREINLKKINSMNLIGPSRRSDTTPTPDTTIRPGAEQGSPSTLPITL